MKLPEKFLKFICSLSGSFVFLKVLTILGLRFCLWKEGIEVPQLGAASVAIIGGADGPTAIYVTNKFFKHSFLTVLLYSAFAVSLFLLIANKILKNKQ